jgi:hypothetical protein
LAPGSVITTAGWGSSLAALATEPSRAEATMRRSAPSVGDGVFDLGVQRDGEVGGDRPGRGRPDDDIERLVGGQAELLGLGGGHEELHPDGDGDVVLVFDLRLGERGLEGDGPIDRLLAAVNEALLDEGGEGAEDVGLEGRGLRLVFVLPVGEDADALELRGLLRDPAFGELIAFGAHLRRGQSEVLLLDLLADLLLDGQAVAIPARHVGRAEALHGLVAVDDVLEGLVQRGADMDVAIGERRAVMQHEGALGAVRALGLDLVVEIELLPVGHPARFALGQTRPHGKISLGQQEGVFEFGRHRK